MKVEITVEINIDEEVTKSQVREWMEFNLYPGVMVDVGANPLVDNDHTLPRIDQESVTDWKVIDENEGGQ